MVHSFIYSDDFQIIVFCASNTCQALNEEWRFRVKTHSSYPENYDLEARIDNSYKMWQKL